MKVSTALTLLVGSLVGAAQFAQAGEDSTRDKRVEKSETRTRSETGEVRLRHRVKTEVRSDRDTREDSSGRRDSGRGVDDRRGHSRAGDAGAGAMQLAREASERPRGQDNERRGDRQRRHRGGRG